MTSSTTASTPAALRQSVYSYRAQTVDGKSFSGTIDAVDTDDAQQQLKSMRLRVLELTEAPKAASARPMGNEEFQAFNHQLAMLTQAGLPLEQSLRMISRDLGSQRLSATIDAVAADLERGTPLGEAFDKHRGKFPPLYGQLVDVGLRTSRLPGVLLSLGRHFELVQRLRSAVWQAMAYPLVLMAMLFAVLMFVGWVILPHFAEIYEAFDTQLPYATLQMLNLVEIMPHLTIGVIVLVVAAVVGWSMARAAGMQGVVVDIMARCLPLIGPVLRRSLAMRWCDTMKMGIEAGMDLPAVLTMAGSTADSPGLRHDSQKMAEALSMGGSISDVTPLHILPAGAPVAMELGAAQGNLAGVLDSLAMLYGKQAELRLGMLNVILLPTMLVFIGTFIGAAVFALLMPLLSLITSLT